MAQVIRAFFKKCFGAFSGWSAWVRLGFLLFCAALILIGVFGVSNLLLSSGWAGDAAARHLKKRTGLDLNIGSASWSPWGGLMAKEVTVLQPEEFQKSLGSPLLSVKMVQVKPHWKMLLRGKAEPSEVIVDEPSITVSVETLVAIAAQYNQPLNAAKPRPPAVKKEAQPKLENKEEAQPKPNIKTGEAPQNKEVKEVSKNVRKPSAEKPPEQKKATQPPLGLPLWLKVNDAKLRVVSVGKKLEVLNLSGVSLDAPIFGEDADGFLKIGEVRLSDQLLVSDVNQVIEWRRPYLKVDNDKLDLLGLRVQLQSQVKVRRGAPKATAFQFALNMKPQPLRDFSFLERVALALDAGRVAGHVRGRGSFFNPLSWRGAALFSGEDVHVKERHGGHQIEFDEVYAPAVFSRGQLRWSGLRVIGEDISILGNGGLSSSGDVLAVTRLVASPEMAMNLRRAMLGAMIPGIYRSWWENLDTPDRKMRDIVLSGNMNNPMVNIMRKYEQTPLWDVVDRSMRFIRREMREEGKVLQARPNH